MQRRSLQTMALVLSTFLLLGSLAVAAKAQTAKALPSDVLAANQELDRQYLEGHQLLDTERIMGLFTSGPDLFMIGPTGVVYKGYDQVRQSVESFFVRLKSMPGVIDHITYLPAGDGVIAVGQVTYQRHFKDGTSDQRIVVWTDFRHKENGRWVYVFRHAHWPLASNSLPDAKPPAKSPTAEPR